MGFNKHVTNNATKKAKRGSYSKYSHKINVLTPKQVEEKRSNAYSYLCL